MDLLRLIKYPIYIISKGRFDTPYTANFLLKADIPFKIAVEPQEYEAYCKNIPRQFVAKLPFSNLGVGSYPARNWCWEDSIALGNEAHYLFDDNIRGFAEFTAGKRIFKTNPYRSLMAMTFFYDRYQNLGMAGFNYSYFITKSTKKPFYLNTKVYSGMLIKNSLSSRWRLKYNEDIDLNFQVLANENQCTIALNTHLIEKISTSVKLKGGNQSELYQGNDPLKKQLKSRSLEMLWPKYVKTTFRFNRPHHQISWNKHFHTPLIKKPDYDDIVKNQTMIWKHLNIK